jgi:hypothetical protein
MAGITVGSKVAHLKSHNHQSHSGAVPALETIETGMETGEDVMEDVAAAVQESAVNTLEHEVAHAGVATVQQVFVGSTVTPGDLAVDALVGIAITGGDIALKAMHAVPILGVLVSGIRTALQMIQFFGATMNHFNRMLLFKNFETSAMADMRFFECQLTGSVAQANVENYNLVKGSLAAMKKVEVAADVAACKTKGGAHAAACSFADYCEHELLPKVEEAALQATNKLYTDCKVTRDFTPCVAQIRFSDSDTEPVLSGKEEKENADLEFGIGVDRWEWTRTSENMKPYVPCDATNFAKATTTCKCYLDPSRPIKQQFLWVKTDMKCENPITDLTVLKKSSNAWSSAGFAWGEHSADLKTSLLEAGFRPLHTKHHGDGSVIAVDTVGVNTGCLTQAIFGINTEISGQFPFVRYQHMKIADGTDVGNTVGAPIRAVIALSDENKADSEDHFVKIPIDLSGSCCGRTSVGSYKFHMYYQKQETMVVINQELQRDFQAFACHKTGSATRTTDATVAALLEC